MITDVFTYGAILLELFTGSKGGVLCQSSLDIRTRSFRKIIDPRLESDYPTHAAKKNGQTHPKMHHGELEGTTVNGTCFGCS